MFVERTPHPIAAPAEIRVFSTSRNERLRLPAFLAHYRRLGADRFFIVDNGSSDGSAEYLDAQPDVHLFRTDSSYREASFGIDWMNALLHEFGIGSWCLAVDVDELLIFPGSENVSLPALTSYLNRQGCEAFFCLLLDFYPAGPLTECSLREGDRLLDVAPYFDSGPYHRIPVEHCPGVLIRGGMRERIFYPDFRGRTVGSKIFDSILYRILLRLPLVRDRSWIRGLRRASPPCLTKVPLVLWHRDSTYIRSTHWMAPQPVAQETGVLMHFKFLADFHSRAVEEVARDEHYDGSTEYRRYAQRLDRDPNMTLVGAESIRFEDTAQLVGLGLMQDTDDWARERIRIATRSALSSAR